MDWISLFEKFEGIIGALLGLALGFFLNKTGRLRCKIYRFVINPVAQDSYGQFVSAEMKNAQMVKIYINLLLFSTKGVPSTIYDPRVVIKLGKQRIGLPFAVPVDKIELLPGIQRSLSLNPFEAKEFVFVMPIDEDIALGLVKNGFDKKEMEIYMLYNTRQTWLTSLFYKKTKKIFNHSRRIRDAIYHYCDKPFSEKPIRI